MPHHITQRGNRRQQTFLSNGDYRAYLELMAEWCGEQDVHIWCYCLCHSSLTLRVVDKMPNHVHLIAVPQSEDGLRRPPPARGEAHRRYTRRVNLREGWRGHLWQGRASTRQR